MQIKVFLCSVSVISVIHPVMYFFYANMTLFEMSLLWARVRGKGRGCGGKH